MAGEAPLEEVYARRLGIVRPLRTAVATIGRRYIEAAVPQARETMAALKMLGKELRIVSGGLRMPVATFAAGWASTTPTCTPCRSGSTATTASIASTSESPLTRSGGKRDVVASLPKKRTAVVGDGMTDAEAASAADCFICFTASWRGGGHGARARRRGRPSRRRPAAGAMHARGAGHARARPAPRPSSVTPPLVP
jgi:phosphoserine phosphatase